MGDQEIEMEVSSDYEEENSSQISQTASNANNKKHYADDNVRSGKNSEMGLGKRKNQQKQVTQQSQKGDKLSEREMRKIQQQIVIVESRNLVTNEKGRKKKQHQGNKTPRSDSSIETEQNQKTVSKEVSAFQANAQQSSLAGKMNGQSNQISIFQHQQQQQQSSSSSQQQQTVQGNGQEGNNDYLASGLDRIVNAALASQFDNAPLLNPNIPQNAQNINYNTQNINQNTQNINQNAQNGSLFSQQQVQHSQQQHYSSQFNGNKIHLPYQGTISSNGIATKDVHVIVTEDDSEMSASCDLDDNKSLAATSSLNINNPNSQTNNSINNNSNNNNNNNKNINNNINNNNNNNINNSNNINSNINNNNNNGFSQIANINEPNINTNNGQTKNAPAAGKRKRTLRKNKDNLVMSSQSSLLAQQQSQQPPNMAEQSSGSSNIEVISTEGKHSNKQVSSRSSQNTNSNPSIQANNTSAAIVSLIPRKQSNQTNVLTCELSQNQPAKQIQQLPLESNGKTIVLQQNPNNSNLIQLKRKNTEEATLINSSIPLSQPNSFQNLEDIQNRQTIEQSVQANTFPLQQQSVQSANLQTIQIKTSANQSLPQQAQTQNSYQSNNAHLQQQQQQQQQQNQHHHHQIVNPQALPHALQPAHNMINIPPQLSNQNMISINNGNNNLMSTALANNNINGNQNETINNNNNINNMSSQSIQQNEKPKKKKRQKNLGKGEAHNLQQQQQMIGQLQLNTKGLSQQQQESMQNALIQQHELQEELVSNQNSNKGHPSIPPSSLQQQNNNFQQQQQGFASPTSNSNTYNQNMFGNFNSNGANRSLIRGQLAHQNIENALDLEQENQFQLQSQESQKIGMPPPIPLGISTSQQLIREQSNSKQNYQSKPVKASRRNDFEYKQRMKKGPLNQSTFEDQPTLFLRLCDYQEQQKKEKEEVIEKHFEELNESSHSQNGSNYGNQLFATSLFQFPASSNNALASSLSTSNKPLLSFKAQINTSKHEQEKLEVNSQENDSSLNGGNKTPVIASGNGTSQPQKSRIKKLDNQLILDKTLIIQDKITKKFKNSHYPDSFKEAFSTLHSDFAQTYLDPSYCTKIVTFFNRYQEFSNQTEKEETEIDY